MSTMGKLMHKRMLFHWICTITTLLIIGAICTYSRSQIQITAELQNSETALESEQDWWIIIYRCTYFNEDYFVTGIPSLVMIDDKGEIINLNGRAAVVEDIDAKVFDVWCVIFFSCIIDWHVRK